MTSTAIILLSIIIFQSGLWFFCRGKSYAKSASDRFFLAIIAGFLTARIAFVIAMWRIYSEDVLAVVDIRDGGFNPVIGWFVGALVLLAGSYREPGILRAYLKSGILTVGLAVPMLIVTSLYSTKPSVYDFALEDGLGNPIDLRQFPGMNVGQPYVVNLWASWCPPCRREMPVLHHAQQTNNNITFLFVNQSEDPDQATQFLTQQSLHLNNVFYDPYGNVATQSGSYGLPTTLFFNADGKLVASHMGELSEASLQHYIDRLH